MYFIQLLGYHDFGNLHRSQEIHPLKRAAPPGEASVFHFNVAADPGQSAMAMSATVATV